MGGRGGCRHGQKEMSSSDEGPGIALGGPSELQPVEAR